MSFLTALHVLNIIAIMVLVFYIRHVQGHKPYSLFWSIIFFLFFLSARGIKWFLANPIYLVRQLLFLILIAIDITLIGQLMENSIFNRPVFILFLSPLAWTLVMLSHYYSEQRHKNIS